jgi:hypothetical protein
MLGQGATGKSHILDTLAELLIPDTTQKITHQTDKATAVDTDNNDHISLYHEATPGLLGITDKDQSTGSHILKDQLTSCEVTTSTIFCDHETGRRFKVKCSSECVGVMIVATNERIDQVPEALSSRFSKITVDMVDRPGFNIIDRGDNKANKDNKSVEAVKKKWRMRQVMTNMVEKAIYTKCLHDVDMTIASHMYNVIVKKLVEFGILTTANIVRTKSFLMGFIRTLTIIHAVDKFANDSQSNGYQSAISFENLLHIQPLLVASEEITLFVITLCYDTLIDVNQFKVLEIFSGTFFDKLQRNERTGQLVVNARNNFTVKNDIAPRHIFYKQLISHIAGNHSFQTKISEENLKVAFTQLLRTTYNGKRILEEKSDGTYEICKQFVDNFFTVDSSKNRFVAIDDLSTIFIKAFQEQYANKYFPTKRKFIVGTPTRLQTPFIMKTVIVEPNSQVQLYTRNTFVNILQDNMTNEQLGIVDIECHLEDLVTANTSKRLYDHSLPLENYTDQYPLNMERRFYACYKKKKINE